MRKQYEYQKRYQPGVNSAIMDGRMSDLERHNIHPLIGLGVNPGGQGFGGAQITGQGDMGEAISRAGADVASAMAQAKQLEQSEKLTNAQIALLKAQARNLSQKPPSGGPAQMGGTQSIPLEGVIASEGAASQTGRGQVKVEPNVIRTRSKEDSSRAAGSNPAWMAVEIWPGVFIDVPWSEEGFAESMDSLPAVASTVARNAGIGYKLAYQYVKRAHSKFYKSRGRNMRTRHPARYKIPPKIPAHRQTTPDIFFAYSRGPHR